MKKKETVQMAETEKKDTIGEVLFTEKDILKRAKELGKQITQDYKGEDLVVLGTLKGSVFWLCDLMKNIDLNATLDFVQASSYGSSTETSGVVKIKLDTDFNLYNKNVLIVEDIVDTGTTLKYLTNKLKERGPKSIKICTMLDKTARRTEGLTADYIGFHVDDLFIIGYGLDYDQKFRNLPYISYIRDEKEIK
jgi:hypoxanthine phosphoribosyltransferase